MTDEKRSAAAETAPPTPPLGICDFWGELHPEHSYCKLWREDRSDSAVSTGKDGGREDGSNNDASSAGLADRNERGSGVHVGTPAGEKAVTGALESTEALRFFLDTEFIESGPGRPIELLSIGIVSEDGRTFYAANADANLTHANEWVRQNVIPHLGGFKLHFDAIRRGVLDFIGTAMPEFWGYYSDYDWVVFCQLFGAMVDLPKDWPMFCRDLKQFAVDCGNPELPAQVSTEHNALNDARWNKQAFEYLQTYASRLRATVEELRRENQQDYAKGFEHAVRNIAAAIEKQSRVEPNADRKLGLRVAADTANSYHGFMDRRENQELRKGLDCMVKDHTL